jgi:hypothetical protein
LGTLLRYEKWIKQHFGPNLGRLRVYSFPASFTISCYVEDHKGDLPAELKSQIESWLEKNRLAGWRSEVKPFVETTVDGVPPRTELPVIIEHLALNAEITVAGVHSSIQQAFPQLGNFQLQENVPGHGHITIIPSNPITPEEAAQVTLYAAEFMPPGVKIHIL